MNQDFQKRIARLEAKHGHSPVVQDQAPAATASFEVPNQTDGPKARNPVVRQIAIGLTIVLIIPMLIGAASLAYVKYKFGADMAVLGLELSTTDAVRGALNDGKSALKLD